MASLASDTVLLLSWTPGMASSVHFKPMAAADRQHYHCAVHIMHVISIAMQLPLNLLVTSHLYQWRSHTSDKPAEDMIAALSLSGKLISSFHICLHLHEMLPIQGSAVHLAVKEAPVPAAAAVALDTSNALTFSAALFA